MHAASQRRDLDTLRGDLRRQRWLIAALTLLTLLLAATIYRQIGRERTIIIPTGLKQSFWATDNAVSASGLEEMGGWAAWVILDVSPANIDYKTNLLLRYTVPESHGVLKTRMALEADRLKRDNASTAFGVQQIIPDERAMAVTLRGRLSTYINGRRVSETDKSYAVEFEYSNRQIGLKTFKDLADENPVAGVAGATAAR